MTERTASNDELEERVQQLEPSPTPKLHLEARKVAALERIADALEAINNGSWHADPHDHGSWLIENRG